MYKLFCDPRIEISMPNILHYHILKVSPTMQPGEKTRVLVLVRYAIALKSKAMPTPTPCQRHHAKVEHNRLD
jgi:hypothetical protein